MRSVSHSEYKSLCVDIIQDAIKRPSMYFERLDQLDYFMAGHAYPFRQLGVLTLEETFNYSFNQWMLTTRSLSGSAGWAYTMNELSQATGQDELTVFKDLVLDFLNEWNPPSVARRGASVGE